MRKAIFVLIVLFVFLVGCAQTPLPATRQIVSTPTPEVATATSTSEAVTATPTLEAVMPTPTPEAATATPTQAAQEIPPSPTPIPPSPTPAPQEPAASTAWTPDGIVGEGEYAHQVEAGGVQFYWSTDAEFLYGALSAKTTGWVSVGFDPQERMQGADYIFGYVREGQLFIEDMLGVRPFGAGSHPPDTELGGRNDIRESGGRESDGVTVIEFKISLDSGDAKDKPLRPGQSYKIVLAWGSRDDFSSMHGGYGYATITIDQ